MTTTTRDQNGNTAPLIRMSGVSKTYFTPAGDFPALKQFDAEFYPGEFVSVVGKSGSGKSTLANMITGIDHPSEGEVIINGSNIHAMSESRMAAWRGINLGIIFQFFQLLPHLTLLENVMLPMDFCAQYESSEREKRGLELLAQVELQDCASCLPAAVSGGEQQRAAIARSLANDPPIVIADEPTGNLDTDAAENVNGIFEGLVQQGKTIIMVTHDRQLASRTHRSLLLSDGEQINPDIFRSLDGLPHPRLLWLTHHMTPLDVDPGSELRPRWMDDLGLLVIKRGSYELVAHHNGNQSHRRYRLNPGHFLSLLDLEELEDTSVSLRIIQDQSGQALFLPRREFEQWMDLEPADRTFFQERAARDPNDRFKQIQSHLNL